MPSRREFLVGGAALAGTSLPIFAAEKKKGAIRLRMASMYPRNSPGTGQNAQAFADKVTALSKGRITIKVFASGELVPAKQSFDAAVLGSADLYYGPEYWWQGKSKAFNWFASIPFGMTGLEQFGWIKHGGGQDLWDKHNAEFGVKSLVAGCPGIAGGCWFKNELQSVSQLKGIKVRMPGLGGEVYRRLGATVVSLPAAKILPALQTGVINATEFATPWSDLSKGFYKFALNYYMPSWHEPGTIHAVGFNFKKWHSLSAQDQTLIKVASEANFIENYSQGAFTNGPALATLKSKHHVAVRVFPEEVIKVFRSTSKQVLAEVANTNKWSKLISKSYNDFMTNHLSYSTVGEQAYLNARNG